MIIGIDFDNTIIDYSTLFYDAGAGLGVLSDSMTRDKPKIRQYLIDRGREEDWIRIQGLVYGKYIENAGVMEGFRSFLATCLQDGWTVYIVSHKTREAVVGEKFDLHAAARAWLNETGIYRGEPTGAVADVFFEVTRSDKIRRINALGCQVFIDDLVEVLMHPDMNREILKILYDRLEHYPAGREYPTAKSWDQIAGIIRGHYA
jgi:hypothetical protein